MTRLRAVVAAAVLALCEIGAASADASIYSKVLRTYEAHASIPPCEFSSQQLGQALKGIDTYGAQYFSDFAAAIQTALSARAAGACQPHPAVSPPARPGPLTPLRLPAVTAATSSGPPLVLVALAALLAALGLGGAVGAAARARGWSPPWLQAWRHAWGEAGYHVGGAWEELHDWVRSERPR